VITQLTLLSNFYAMLFMTAHLTLSSLFYAIPFVTAQLTLSSVFYTILFVTAQRTLSSGFYAIPFVTAQLTQKKPNKKQFTYCLYFPQLLARIGKQYVEKYPCILCFMNIE
jgi:hypothetical protein